MAILPVFLYGASYPAGVFEHAHVGGVRFGPFWHQNRGQTGQAGRVPGMPGQPGVFQGATPGGLHPHILVLVDKTK